MKTNPQKIRELRRKLDLTQEELAKKVGTSHAMISLYESQPREPRTKRLDALAEALHTSKEELEYKPQVESTEPNLKEAIKTLLELKPELQEAISLILQALKDAKT